MKRFVAIVFAFGLAVGVAAQSTDAQRTTVWQGVYTEEQASRGQSEYTAHCARCHRDDLGGYSNILKGARFMEKNRESSLHMLFDKTKTTMPRGAPASLSDNAYVDIVAYILKANEFPAGAQELRVEDLRAVQVVGKQGPEPVPDFSLVRVVGCLGTSAGVWTLSNATEPVRTGNPQPAAGEREESQGWRLGATTYRLLVSAAYKPEASNGHRVEIRGFLIRRPSETRINISSLESLDPSCGE